MKEHPDYKYRPRRKPKPLLKKEQKFGFTLSPSHLENSNIVRGLMPPISTATGLPQLLHNDHDHLKFTRSLFPPLPYLYHPFRHSEESKLAAELALLYSNNTLYPPSINWPIGNLSNNVNTTLPCNICPPTFSSRRSPSPESMKRPVCVIMKNEEFRNDPLPAHVIWKPLPVLPEHRLNLGTWFGDVANLATSSAMELSQVGDFRDSQSGRDSDSPCDMNEKDGLYHG